MTLDNEKPQCIGLAEQASKETDHKKLSSLVEQLCAAIDSKVRPNVDITNRADSNLDS